MPRNKKKTYLDLFLDNAELKDKKEKEKKEPKKDYFTDVEQGAILQYNSGELSAEENNALWANVIYPCLVDTALGVLKMPKFHKLPKGLDREQLVDDVVFRLMEKLDKFLPGMIGKNGQPVKAFSYFSTVAKNYVLEKIFKHNKVINNKADVETSIDLYILSEDTLSKMTVYNFIDVESEDYETKFKYTKKAVINILDDIIKVEESKLKKDEEFIKVGYFLKYILEKWHKIEFDKKNEFMRILTLYTGMKQQQVSTIFKRFKTIIGKELKVNTKTPKKIIKAKKFEDEEDDNFEVDNSQEVKFEKMVNSLEDYEFFGQKLK